MIKHLAKKTSNDKSFVFDIKKEGPKRVHYYNWEKETQEERKKKQK